MGLYNLQVPGVVESLVAYVSSGTCRMALYQDNGGTPTTLIAQTGVVSGSSWETAGIAQTNLPAGNYWIAVQSSSYSWSANQSSLGYYYANYSWGSFPASLTGGVKASGYQLMVRANYCPLAPTFTSTSTPTPYLTSTPTLTPNPTCAQTPGTFGDASTTGGYSGSSAVELMGGTYVLSTAGTLNQIRFTTIGSGVGFARVGLYANDSGTNAPTTLIVENSYDVAVTTNGTFSVDVPETALSAGTYWLAIMLRPTVIGTGTIPGIPEVTGSGYSSFLGNTWSMPTTFGGTSYSTKVALVGVYCHP
jgi:hypothetical protein